MKILRTPDERFQNLSDYEFEPHYLDIDEMRMHYVDEGPADAPPVLLLHGEPSWSYLYRHMIPPIVSAGLRAIAPDLIGFGKSDKPASQSDYTYEIHVAWMLQFLEESNLRNITLVCQDWGSLIGLRLAAENEERFDRIILANGGLPTGDQVMPKVFRIWRAFARFSPWFPIGRIVQSGTVSTLPPDVIAAYDAPFPNSTYKAGARAFPKLVPTTPDDPAASANRAAWEVFRKWQKPFLTAFSNRDPITRGADQAFLELVPGANDQPHTTIRNAGHFLQEDKGPELAKVIIDFVSGQ
jgi:haloalkane dehalogenase